MKIILPSDLHQLLGGLTPAVFLKHYWQQKPLLIRRAIPGFTPPVSRAELFELARRDEVESRLVSHRGGAWSLEQGPFERRRLRRADGEKWTLLVQGVNLHAPDADALLNRFDFVPRARLDDLMISWASDGGGVGPHFDSYDVFLLQAQGRRHWRVSAQGDRTIKPGLPLKILKSFKAEAEYVLEPGDMLYVPPGVAHDGVAVGECMTCSIGFRAPAAAELARGFLEYLAEHEDRPGMYADPGLKPTGDAALIDDALVRRAARLAWPVRPTRAAFEDFLGRYLTDPKALVFFDPPERPLGRGAFARGAARRGVRLDLKTLMLHRGKLVYINGESHAMPAGAGRGQLRELARRRALGPGVAAAAALEMLYSWYLYGWLELGKEAGDGARQER
jgi:50S ribosomal protein L16 3-hydroxylase